MLDKLETRHKVFGFHWRTQKVTASLTNMRGHSQVDRSFYNNFNAFAPPQSVRHCWLYFPKCTLQISEYKASAIRIFVSLVTRTGSVPSNRNYTKTENQDTSVTTRQTEIDVKERTPNPLKHLNVLTRACAECLFDGDYYQWN